MMLRKRVQGLRRSQTFFAKNEDGLALMIVLIVLVGLTVLATAGMVITTTEIRISENTEAGTYAFYAADAGLAEFHGTDSINGTDTVTYTYVQGTATVWGEKLLNVNTDSTRVLYRITSQGTHGSPGAGQTSRTVSVVAIQSDGEFPFSFRAAFTAPTGLIKSGASGILSGFNTADTTECADAGAPDVAGVSVPQVPGYAQTNGESVPTGNPDILVGPDGLSMLDSLGIDWAAMLAGGVVTPDYTIPPDLYPFTENDVLDPTGWPVIFVDADYYLLQTWKQSGRGLLIVRGDFETKGGFEWDGVVLIGGKLQTSGAQVYNGAIVTGLNMLLGDTTVAEAQLGNGNINIQYNSCHIENAFGSLYSGPTLAEEPGTWAESM